MIALKTVKLRCNLSEPLNAYVCKESHRDKYKITKQRRHRRIRDRQPSRIPVRRVLKKLEKNHKRQVKMLRFK